MIKNNRLTIGIFGSLAFIALLWCIKSAEILFHLKLSTFGVVPLSYPGLLGIITAPFIHGSLEHIFNNTLPILIMGSVLYYGYPKSWKKVLALTWILSGIGVWLFARNANHIGASGIIHGVFFFLLVVSIFRRDKSSVAIMMITFLLYGGMTMSIFPREESISFEYHLFGALAGIISAFLWKNLDPKPAVKKYDWEHDDNQIENDDIDNWQVNIEGKHPLKDRTLH
ncbi:rhomboid family intramembrane serine protease [Paraglaciecola aquimarina]|uniref:Rhomboid family intramembrane serine protease n=1 Tax=Paraglaciecola aquimarina TaxID=1235557 RepID=A0ABU3SYX6_9ALTE|nr:rhomboid family intramembrane serine protease [Paraglaciecola aquimarina]MDU0355172.1 rhomboid family intramembrane serine protease [Paraglaciecola aquimarina]